MSNPCFLLPGLSIFKLGIQPRFAATYLTTLHQSFVVWLRYSFNYRTQINPVRNTDNLQKRLREYRYSAFSRNGIVLFEFFKNRSKRFLFLTG